MPAFSSGTPPQDLHRIIRPNGLHYEHHDAGVPAVDPDNHRLLIHGLVDRPLIVTMDDILRFPSISKIHFLGCSGNRPEYRGSKPACTRQDTHGLSTYCKSTGVPLRRKRGYALRLFLPGFEGNMSVKWLRRPSSVTSRVKRMNLHRSTYLIPNRIPPQFTSVMEAKSVITGRADEQLRDPGFHEIIGLAWTAGGRIRRVGISTDGGRPWDAATLQEPILWGCLTRFRLLWTWDGGSALSQSRAVDETRYVRQPHGAPGRCAPG